MFSKKIKPDFSKRTGSTQAPARVQAPVQNVVLRENILISESQKTYAPPPAPPPPSQPPLSRLEKLKHLKSMASALSVPVAVQTLSEPPPAPVDLPDPTPSQTVSSFSANLETFTSIGDSYFQLAADAQDVADWSRFPAVSIVEMDGFGIRGASQITTVGMNVNGRLAVGSLGASFNGPVTILGTGGTLGVSQRTTTQDLTVNSGTITLVDASGSQILQGIGTDLFYDGQLIAKANDIQNISDWALYPAIGDVDVNGKSLNLVEQITDVSGGFGTVGQVLSSTGSQIAWTTPSAGNANQWATFPAVQNVDVSGQSLNRVAQLTDVSGGFGTAGQLLSSDGSKIVWTTPVVPPSGVTTLNTQSGAIDISSANANLTVDASVPGTILLTAIAAPGGVPSVNGETGPITITTDPATVTVTPGPAGTFTFAAPTLGVSTDLTTTCFGVANSASLSASAASLAAGGAATAAASAQATADSALIAAGAAQATASTALAQSGVTSVNGGTFAATIAAGTGISVATTYGSGVQNPTVTISATGASGVDINGLLNKINAFPALPYTDISSSTPAQNQVATAIVPDGTFPVNVPTVGTVQGGWGFSKANGSAAFFSYYQYNPRFGAPAAPLPYIKSRVQSAWALIRPTVNLYLAGLLAINLYSFDDANPPTSSFFNTRWAYSNSVGAVAGATGTNLYAGYTYLLYANDAPRITNTSAIGVPDSQVSGLRDPYDIYTDVNHIALQNCVVAFNPWTNGTNFRTWRPTASPAFTTGDTVIFAGFGTNYNGLFFVATGVPAAATPPMVNGVVSANWALIQPQPSSFADQPVVGITLTQATDTGQAVGYVVLDIGFSYGPTTTSTTVSQHISLLPN